MHREVKNHAQFYNLPPRSQCVRSFALAQDDKTRMLRMTMPVLVVKIHYRPMVLRCASQADKSALGAINRPLQVNDFGCSCSLLRPPVESIAIGKKKNPYCIAELFHAQ